MSKVKVTHPSWCHRESCTATPTSGSHLSQPIVVHPRHPSTIRAEVSLHQGVAIAGYPLSDAVLIAVAFYDEDDHDDQLCDVPLHVTEAATLGLKIISAVRQAAEGGETGAE